MAENEYLPREVELLQRAKELAVQVEHGGCECTCQACFAMRRMAHALLRKLEE